jgi:SOUL heme-binding protein
MLSQALLTVGLVTTGSLSDTPRTPAALTQETGVRAGVGTELRHAVGLAMARDPVRSTASRVEALREAGRTAADRLGTASLVGRGLKRLSDPVVGESESAALERLERELRERALDLVFEPLVESPRPVGFPAATPVGEIATLDYPSYRMARTTMSRGLGGGSNSAFWKLFRHIQSNEISMTAPVEMTLGKEAGSQRMEAMAFLYENQQIGKTGVAGAVEVVDVPGARVVSMGMRGADRGDDMKTALDALREWIALNPNWEAAGPARVMGWNSPMVSSARRFQEVQIPIRASTMQADASVK